jgi:hypothetical protein
MKALIVAIICALMIIGGGCSGGRDGGQQRGLFTGYVMDKTEKEIESKFGKPAAVEAVNPNTQKWVYKRITFDPDNQNQVDNETILIFQKDSGGAFKVTQVVFG